MVRTLVYKALRHRHFWREIQFDELSELYANMLLRSLANNVLFVFVPFFLYQQGYSIQQLFLMYACFFGARVIGDVAGGYLVARIGPKHAQISSVFLQIVSAAQFLTVPDYKWSIVQLGAVWGFAASLYFIAHHVQFSKIKHTVHAGKELGYMNIMTQIGAFIGPLVGGLVGNYLNSKYIFLIAAGILIASLWPLFQSAEPVRINQQLHFRALPLRKIKRDLMSYGFLGVENTLCINLWPLYISIFVFTSGVYVKLGILTSLSVAFAIFFSYFIGRTIDIRNARLILRTAAVLNACVYGVRPFVQSVTGVFAVNLANEGLTSSYRMPYTKGMYAAADDLPGLRIVYIVVMEVFCSVMKGLFWLLMAGLTLLFAPKTVIFIGFMIAAVASLGIMTERYKVLAR